MSQSLRRSQRDPGRRRLASPGVRDARPRRAARGDSRCMRRGIGPCGRSDGAGGRAGRRSGRPIRPAKSKGRRSRGTRNDPPTKDRRDVSRLATAGRTSRRSRSTATSGAGNLRPPARAGLPNRRRSARRAGRGVGSRKTARQRLEPRKADVSRTAGHRGKPAICPAAHRRSRRRARALGPAEGRLAALARFVLERNQ